MQFLRLFTTVVPVLLKLKQAIFADGKFKLNRAIVILISVLLCSYLATQFTPEGIDFILEDAEQISDMIGYVE